MSFRGEPCGRCGHDVNAHLYDEENEMANECEREGCTCDGFVTKTARTEAKYEPFTATSDERP